MPFVSIEWNMGDIISSATYAPRKSAKIHLSWVKLFNTLSISISLDLAERWNLVYPLWPQNLYISVSGGPCRGWEIALRPKDWQQVGIHSFSKSNTINVWRKCNPSTWSSNIRGMWRLTFYPRNPYEATGMVKRPWDQQVFFLSNANTQMFISFIEMFPLFQLSINPDQSWSILQPVPIVKSSGGEGQVRTTRHSYQVLLHFLPGIIVFPTSYYCISFQVLLYFLPVIIVFLPRYYCISLQVLLYLCSSHQLANEANLFLHRSPTESQWLTRMGMSGLALSAGKLRQMQKPKWDILSILLVVWL